MNAILNWLYGFFKDNISWISVLFAIALSMLAKLSSKPGSIPVTPSDLADFGYDLAMSAIILVLTSIGNGSINAEPLASLLVILLFFTLIMIVSIVVTRIGWSKENNEDQEAPNALAIILPDILGIVLLSIAVWFIGG